MTASVFIGMPVYNAQATLRSALASLLAQTHTDLRILVSDNGSTDQTYQIALDCARQDQRVQVVRSPVNRGPTWNFNTVLQAAERCPFFMWAAHDDLWAADYVTRCVGVLLRDATVVLSGTQARFVDTTGAATGEIDVGVTTVGLPPVERAVRYLNEVNRNSVFYGVYRGDAVRGRQLVNRLGGDQLFLFDLCLVGALSTVPEALLTRRTGGTSRTAAALYQGLAVKPKLSPRFFRVDVYAGLLRHALTSNVLNRKERLALAWAVARGGLRRHALPNLRPRRLSWWIRHGGTSSPPPN
jgi:glycosyltransferase involved in cell wall biosynthesis